MSRTVVQNGLSLGFALMIAGSVLVAPSPAAWIPIDNHSFENPVLSDNGSVNTKQDGLFYGWTVTGDGTGGAVGLIGSWVYLRNTSGYFENDADGGLTGGVPTGGDGKNCLNPVLSNYNGGGAGAGSWTFSQTLGDVFQAGTYTLTAAVGYPAGNRYPVDDYSIRVLAGSTVLGAYSAEGSDLTQGEFEERLVTFDVLSDSEHLGQPITIELFAGAAFGSGNGWKQMGFDNVRLQFIPEPGTVALLIGGLAGLACLPWRRRRR